MKKLLSIILTLAMVLSTFTFVYADENLVDVAKDMTAFSNTYFSASAANNAIDGNPETFFYGAVNTVGGVATQAYWYVDLGAAYPIKKISFLPGANETVTGNGNIGRLLDVYLTNTRPTACTVEGALQVYDGSSTPISIEDYTHIENIESNESYRYVLISKDATKDNLGVALKEVNVYTDEDSYNSISRGEGYVNIAANKPSYTTANTSENSQYLVRGNDGCMGSTGNQFYCIGRSVYGGQWFMPEYVIDLNDAYNIKYLNLGSGIDAVADNSVYFTNDPSLNTLTEVITDYDQRGGFQFDLFEVPDEISNTPYRYIVLKSGASCAIEIGEIEAYVARSEAKETDFDNQQIVEVSRGMSAYCSTDNANSKNQTLVEPVASNANDGNYMTLFAYTQGNSSAPAWFYIDLGAKTNIHSVSYFTNWGKSNTSGYQTYVNNEMKLIATNDSSKPVAEWDVISISPNGVKRNDGRLKILPVDADKLNNQYRYVGVYFNQQYHCLAFEEFKVHTPVASLKDIISPITATLSGTNINVTAKIIVPTTNEGYSIIAAAYKTTDVNSKRLVGVNTFKTAAFIANTVNGALYNNNAVGADALNANIDISNIDIANADVLKVYVVDNWSCMKPIVSTIDIPLN